MAVSWISFVRFLLLLVLVAGNITALFTLPVEKILKDFLIWIIESVGPWGLLVLAIAYIPLTVLSARASILTLGGDYLFGLPSDFIAESVGATIGAIAAFLLCKTIVLLLRLMPLLPFNMPNYLLSVTPVDLGECILASWLGMMVLISGNYIFHSVRLFKTNVAQNVDGQSFTCNNKVENKVEADKDTDEVLLRKLKQVEDNFLVITEELSEMQNYRNKSSKTTVLLQMIQKINEDRKSLALELSLQLKSRLLERYSAKEKIKQSKVELDIRTRRLEKEKWELQTCLLKELDNRSVKLDKFQHEGQLLRERVRGLAEQNVSRERELQKLRLLKEKMYDKELELEQLQGDLASSIRENNVLQETNQNLQDEISWLSQKKIDMEIQMMEKDEIINQLHKNKQVLMEDMQVSMEEVNSFTDILQNVTKDRDMLSKERKNLRKSILLKDNEISLLRKKIEALGEVILIQEGHISILKTWITDYETRKEYP